MGELEREIIRLRRQNYLIMFISAFIIILIFVLHFTKISEVSALQPQKQILQEKTLRVSKIEFVVNGRIVATIQGGLERGYDKAQLYERPWLIFTLGQSKDKESHIGFTKNKNGGEICVKDNNGLIVVCLSANKYGGNIFVNKIDRKSFKDVPAVDLSAWIYGGTLGIWREKGDRTVIDLVALPNRGEIVVWTSNGQELFRTPATK